MAISFSDAKEGGENTRILISVITGCFTLTSTLVPVIDSRRQRRDAQQRAEKELSLAIQEVAFWRGWLEVCSSLEGSLDLETIHATAKGNLLRIADEQEKRLLSSDKLSLSVPSRPLYQRILLWYKPRSAAAWLPRALLYALCGYLILSIETARSSDWIDPVFLSLLFALIGCIALVHLVAARTGDRRS